MDRQKLLHEIMALDFTLIDLNLYLDTHPYDSNTIMLFNDTLLKSKRLKMQYEQKFGPITPMSNNNCYWQWAMPPWPWQKSFNL